MIKPKVSGTVDRVYFVTVFYDGHCPSHEHVLNWIERLAFTLIDGGISNSDTAVIQ